MPKSRKRGTSSGSEPTKLHNIGPVSTGWLNEIGVFTDDDLRQMGAIEAYCRIRENHPDRVTIMLLYGLEAALLKRHWNDIPPEYKAELKAKAAEWKPHE